MRTNLYKLMVSAALGALTFTSFNAAAAVNSKLASDVRANLSIAGEQRVIVTYIDGLDETRILGLVAKAGAGAKRFAGSPAFAASLSRRAIEALESDSRVARISADRKVVATMDIAVPTIGADRLNRYMGYSGKGVTVAVIDSGITPNTAVPASRILASIDFTGAMSTGDGIMLITLSSSC